MIFNRNVFRFGMHHSILGDIDGVCVIAKDGNRFIEIFLKILQSFLHPKNLSTQVAVATYSASDVDNEFEDFFLLNHETRQPPR